jgi:hypothetical protein
MGINVIYYQIPGHDLVAESSDINFGDAETKEVTINKGGRILKVGLRKPNVTFNIRGATSLNLTQLRADIENTIRGMIFGSYTTQTLDIGGYVIEDAVMVSVRPSGPTIIEGISVFEQIEMVWNSIGNWTV